MDIIKMSSIIFIEVEKGCLDVEKLFSSWRK